MKRLEEYRMTSSKKQDKAGFVFAGTPEECIEHCSELKGHLADLNFDQLVIGVPLGPDIPEALRLLGKEVIPRFLS